MIFKDGPISVKINEITTNNVLYRRNCIMTFYFDCIFTAECSSYDFTYIDRAMFDFLFTNHYDYRLFTISHYYTVNYRINLDPKMFVIYKYNPILELSLMCLRNITQDIPYYSTAICSYYPLDINQKVFEFIIKRDNITKKIIIEISKYNSLDEINWFMQAMNYNKSMKNLPYSNKINVKYNV